MEVIRSLRIAVTDFQSSGSRAIPRIGVHSKLDAVDTFVTGNHRLGIQRHAGVREKKIGVEIIAPLGAVLLDRVANHFTGYGAATALEIIALPTPIIVPGYFLPCLRIARIDLRKRKSRNMIQ